MGFVIGLQGVGAQCKDNNIESLVDALKNYLVVDAKYARSLLRDIDDLVLAWAKVTAVVSSDKSLKGEAKTHRNATLELLQKPQEGVIAFLNRCMSDADISRVYPKNYVDQIYVNRTFNWCNDRKDVFVGKLYLTTEISKIYRDMFDKSKTKGELCNVSKKYIDSGKLDRKDNRINFARTKRKEDADRIRSKINEKMESLDKRCAGIKAKVRREGSRYLVYAGKAVSGKGIVDSCVKKIKAVLADLIVSRYRVGKDMYVTRPKPLW